MRRSPTCWQADRRRTGRRHLWGDVGATRDERRGLLQRLRRHGRRRLGGHVGLPEVAEAVRHRRGRTHPRQLLDDAPAARAAYVLPEDLRNLDQVCDDLLRADSADVRDETKVYYLGDFEGESPTGS